MAGFPRSAVGIFGFVILTGFLISLLYSTNADFTGETTILTESQTEINNAANDLRGDPGIFGSITAVFTIILDILVILINMIAFLFTSFILFVVQVSGVPFIISGIFIALLTVGLIFALISKLVELDA